MNVELGLRLPLDLLECFGEFEPLQGQIRNQFCQILRFLPFYRVLLKWHLSRPRSHIQRPNSAKNQSWKFLPSEIRRRVVRVKNPHFHEILNSELHFRFFARSCNLHPNGCKIIKSVFFSNFYTLKYGEKFELGSKVSCMKI